MFGFVSTCLSFPFSGILGGENGTVPQELIMYPFGRLGQWLMGYF
jgi:hypothetical protein